MSRFERGLIEGFYGQEWSWAERHQYADFLSAAGYDFYLYAPKGDPYFRKKWREPLPAELERNLAELVETYHAADLSIGVGLSPYELYRDFSQEAQAALAAKLETLNRLGIDRLAILFDDMRGDLPSLAAVQAGIMHWIAERSQARQLLMCPTYYTLDPILDRLFGARPENYLEELGEKLDPSIQVFWTGEKVCSTGYTEEHLRAIGEKLGRKPTLWDNYPVNDGPKMCKRLHLKPFTGRPGSLSEVLAAHVVNPMNQAFLSRIPLLTLAASYELGSSYRADEALSRAAEAVAGPELGPQIVTDIPLFQEQGLDVIEPELKQTLRAKYAAFDHPAAREIVHWLEGRTVVTAFTD